MPSLDELRRRHAAGAPKTEASPAPAASGRHPSGAAWRSVKPVVETAEGRYDPNAIIPRDQWQSFIQERIVRRIVELLPDSRVELRALRGYLVHHQSRDWSPAAAVKEVIEQADYPGTTVGDLTELIETAAQRLSAHIRKAAIGRLFPEHNEDDGSTDPPPTSRSPGTPRKGGVDMGKLRASAKTLGAAPAPPPPSTMAKKLSTALDKRFTISVDGYDAVMNVGKFKGQCLTDIIGVDKGYLEWVLSNKHTGDFKPWPSDFLDVVRYVLNHPMKRRPK